MTIDDDTPWSRNGWEGRVTSYRGTPIGLLNLRLRKGSRMIMADKLTPEQINNFDPDQFWEAQS
jgi:hypothetical protein